MIPLKWRHTTGRVWPGHVSGVCRAAAELAAHITSAEGATFDLKHERNRRGLPYAHAQTASHLESICKKEAPSITMIQHYKQPQKHTQKKSRLKKCLLSWECLSRPGLEPRGATAVRRMNRQLAGYDGRPSVRRRRVGGVGRWRVVDRANRFGKERFRFGRVLAVSAVECALVVLDQEERDLGGAGRKRRKEVFTKFPWRHFPWTRKNKCASIGMRTKHVRHLDR